MEPAFKIALAGVGTFGGDVHLRAYADLRRFGSAGQFARVGLDKYSRELSSVKFDIVAVATCSQKSVEKPAVAFAEWIHLRKASRSARARYSSKSRRSMRCSWRWTCPTGNSAACARDCR